MDTVTCDACGAVVASKVVQGITYPERHQLRGGRWCRGTVLPVRDQTPAAAPAQASETSNRKAE